MTKDVFLSDIDQIPEKEKWIWRHYSKDIYLELKKRFSKTDIFTRVDLRSSPLLSGLAPSAKRAAISVTFKHLVAKRMLVQVSKTRFALVGAKVKDNAPRFLHGKYRNIWMNHGYAFQQAIRKLPRNKLFDRSTILSQIEWLPEKSIGTRYVYFSMIEPEVIGRGILRSVGGETPLYKR